LEVYGYPLKYALPLPLAQGVTTVRIRGVEDTESDLFYYCFPFELIKIRYTAQPVFNELEGKQEFTMLKCYFVI
jgi:hypothetical protein